MHISSAWCLWGRDFLFLKASSAVRRPSVDDTQPCNCNTPGCCSCPEMWLKMHRAGMKKTESKKNEAGNASAVRETRHKAWCWASSLSSPCLQVCQRPVESRQRRTFKQWLLLIQGSHLLPSISRHLLIKAGTALTSRDLIFIFESGYGQQNILIPPMQDDKALRYLDLLMASHARLAADTTFSLCLRKMLQTSNNFLRVTDSSSLPLWSDLHRPLRGHPWSKATILSVGCCPECARTHF